MFHPDNTAISNNKIAYTYVYLFTNLQQGNDFWFVKYNFELYH